MVLDRIVAEKRKAVESRRRDEPLERFRHSLQPAERSLCEALRKPHCGFIMECKKASPSRGLLRADFDPAEVAKQYAGVADAISVLTDQPFFQGRMEHLSQVRAVVSCPVLCKDFVVHPYQVFEARWYGADAILLMLSVLDDKTMKECLQTAAGLGMDALVEVHDQQELDRALDLGVTLIGINNRDLKTLEVRLEVTEQLAPRVPDRVVLVSESGIQDHRDVLRLRYRVDGLLVGSSLMQHDDIARAARELVFGRVKVCGLTDPHDALEARQAGAGWGGLIFAEESPRRVQPEQAAELCQAVGLQWAGVFVNPDPQRVARLAHRLGLEAVQLHGEESPDQVRQLRLALPERCAIWKAWRVRESIPPIEQTGAERLVLDGYQQGRRGGTGRAFDWTLVESHPQREELILGGGLRPSNAEAAGQLGTWALDVNSGVERSPGRKSPDRLRAFFAALRGGSRTTWGASG